ncbi:MAG: PspC domain-containing protein [Dehalococcoidia bacterium]|nr:PspC domain-containing protein [Dehalococcoidia bacterium]
MENRLYRSRTDRMLFGVCGGLAKYFGIDSSLMRIIVVLLALASGIGILVYFIMAFIVPLEGTTRSAPRDVVAENVEEIKTTATEFGQTVKDTFAGKKTESGDMQQVQSRRRNAFGVIIILVGVILLLATLGVFHWAFWSVLWPIVLILIGLVIIISVSRKS